MKKRIFWKTFCETMKMFLAVLGSIAGFFAFIFAVVKIINWLEPIIGTGVLLIFAGILVIIAGCALSGYLNVRSYNTAKEKYENACDEYKEFVKHHTVLTPELAAERTHLQIKIREAEEVMKYWEE